MTTRASHQAVFVTSAASLADLPGGIQVFTREYRRVLTLAGLNLTDVTFDVDRSWNARFSRRAFRRPYRHRIPPSCVPRIVETSRTLQCNTVFLSGCDILEIAGTLRARLPELRLVFVSHGLESVDLLHTLRSRDTSEPFGDVSRGEVLSLGRTLVEECQQRRFIDATICLSPLEVEIERWLGTPQITWLPRVVTPNLVPWKPVSNRVGFVGTLDHPPTVEGLNAYLSDASSNRDRIVVRVVGGPRSHGEQLARKYRCVEYLGNLSEDALLQEASTWKCFLHPLFCYARGASTKLATGISWGIPVVTTPAGCRGYEWEEGDLIQATSPEDFAEEVRVLCNDEGRARIAMNSVRAVCNSSPNWDTVSIRAAEFLQRLFPPERVTTPLKPVQA